MVISYTVLSVIICFCRCFCRLVDQIDVEIPPVLTLLPDRHWFLIGESVTLNCVVPNNANKQYTFFRDYFPISTQYSLTFDIQNLEHAHGGLYRCETLQNNANSVRSNNKSIHVYALPPLPMISLEPKQDLYIAGQPVAMTCSTFKDNEQKLLRFYRNGQKILSLESWIGSATLHIDTSLPGSGGKYGCDYQTERLGKWMSSEIWSVSVNISGPSLNVVSTSSVSSTTRQVQNADAKTTSPAILSSTADETTDRKTLPTSFFQTTELKRNREVTTKTQETHISTGTAINTVSTTSISSTSKQVQSTDAKTSPAILSSTASALLTSQNIIESQWTTPNKLTTTSSYDFIEAWRDYIVAGCFLFILICVILVAFLISGYFSGKRKKAKSVNAPLWMNISDTKTSEETCQETEIAMTVHRNKDLHIYTEVDQCPPLMKLSSASRPSASMGSLVISKPSGVPKYSTVQAVIPLPYVYSTPLSQKSLQASCPTLLQPADSFSSIN